MKKLIATHNKMFHADEITAIALLEVFTDFEIEVQRVDHDTKDFSKYDFVIDIGKKYDGIKYFDHHQYKGGKSSAGLIWDYLSINKQYPNISKLIDLVDRNDVGIEKAKPFEYSSLIKCYNSRNIISEEQDNQFNQAIDFANLPTDIIWKIGFVVVFSTFLTYLLNLVSMRELKPTTVAVFIYLQPLFATIFAVSLGKDDLSLVKLISAVLIFVGVYLVTQKKITSDK